jgi:hypothetical protein
MEGNRRELDGRREEEREVMGIMEEEEKAFILPHSSPLIHIFRQSIIIA